MRILVTGAGGFIGGKLVSLLKEHDVIALDSQSGQVPAADFVDFIAGDIRDSDVVDQCLAAGVEAIAHLATVTGGGAEQNPELA